MLGPVTSRLIPGAGLYLINVTDTLARVNATARLFRSFICVPCLPSPHRIRATCESVHGLFLTFTRVHPPGISDRSERSFWKRERWLRKISTRIFHFFLFFHQLLVQVHPSKREGLELKRILSKVELHTHNAYFVYDTKARNPPLISRQAGAVPRLSSSSVRLDDNPRPLWVERASKVRICNGIPRSVPADFGR